jgi:hypothetical protein
MKELPPAYRSIPSGLELVEGLAQAFSKHQGWVQAVGFVADAELRLGGEAADVRRVFRGRFALAQLSGPLGGPYGATLSRMDGDRLETLAGVLLHARSEGVSALCLSANTTATQPFVSPPNEAPQERPLVPPHARGPKPSSFAARVGLAGAPEEEEEARPMPERGDLVDHFTFGLCEVLSVTGDRLVLRDLRGPGRIREIAADRLDVTGPGEHDGRRLYRLTKRL